MKSFLFVLILLFSLSANSSQLVALPTLINSESSEINAYYNVETEIFYFYIEDLIPVLNNKNITNSLPQQEGVITLDDLIAHGIQGGLNEELAAVELYLPLSDSSPIQLSLTSQEISNGERLHPSPISGYVNTSVTTGFQRDEYIDFEADPFVIRLDGAINVLGTVFESSGVRDHNGLIYREDTRVSKDFGSVSKHRVSIGDIYYPIMGFQSFRKVGGISVYSNPFRVNSLSAQPSGRIVFVKRPARLTFMVNGLTVAIRDVGPGVYDVRDLPVAIGHNNVTVRIEEKQSGHVEYVNFDEFTSVYGIKKGRTEYSISLGVKTLMYGDERYYDTDSLEVSQFFRYDLTNRYALTEYFQSGDEVIIGGVINTFHYDLGYIEVDTAFSRSDEIGYATRLSFQADQKSTLSLLKGDRAKISIEGRSEDFSQVGLQMSPLKNSISLWYGLPSYRKTQISLGSSYSIFDNSDARTLSASLTRPFGNLYIMSQLSQTQLKNQNPTYVAGVSLTYTPGITAFNGSSIMGSNGAMNNSLSFTKMDNTALRGSVSTSTGHTANTSHIQISGNAPRGELTFTGTRNDFMDNTFKERFSFGGRFALAFTNKSVALGLPVSDSFILTKTKNNEDSVYRIESWGRHAETGALGEALLPISTQSKSGVRAFEGSLFSERSEFHRSYLIDQAYKGGYTLGFIDLVDLVEVTLSGQRDFSLKLGTLTHVSSNVSTEVFIGENNTLYLEHIEVGEYLLTIDDKTFSFELKSEDRFKSVSANF